MLDFLMVFAQNLEPSSVSARESVSRRNLCVSSLPRRSHRGVSALDFSYSCPFIAPLRSRWSPVALPWKTPSISFLSMPLQDVSLSQRGGMYTPPPRPSFSSVLSLCLGGSVAILSRLFPAHPKIAPVSLLESALPKLLDLKSFRIRTSGKIGGRGIFC